MKKAIVIILKKWRTILVLLGSNTQVLECITTNRIWSRINYHPWLKGEKKGEKIKKTLWSRQMNSPKWQMCSYYVIKGEHVLLFKNVVAKQRKTLPYQIQLLLWKKFNSNTQHAKKQGNKEKCADLCNITALPFAPVSAIAPWRFRFDEAEWRTDLTGRAGSSPSQVSVSELNRYPRGQEQL